MSDESREDRMVRLVAQAVSAAVDSGMSTVDVIACFGMASKILLQQPGIGAASMPDPHIAFAKGIAEMQIQGVDPAAYH